MLKLNKKTGLLESKGINLSEQGQREFFAMVQSARAKEYDFSGLFNSSTKKEKRVGA